MACVETQNVTEYRNLHDIKKVSHKQGKKVKFFLTLFFAVLSLLSFFFPFAMLKFDRSVYKVSLIDILISCGFNFNDGIIPISVFFRGIVALSLFILIIGVIFFICGKSRISAVLFACEILIFMLFLLVPAFSGDFLASYFVSEFKIYFMWSFFVTVGCSLLASVCSIFMYGAEELAKAVFFVFALVSVSAILLITIYILVSGVPAIGEIGFLNFILGGEWNPENGLYGILPLILSSISGTLGAILLGVPIGVLTAVFLSEMSNKIVAGIVRPAINLLAGIPSVVYGFFGMLIIVPFIRNTFKGYTIGHSLLSVIIILSIMVLPTIVSISENAIKAVPSSYREASLALGTTKVKTIFKVTIKAAKSGILSGIILGVGRAIGETMAVIMVAGNVVNMPSLLGSVRLLTTGIVLELPYSYGLHRQALFAIGLVLFVFITIVNISFTMIINKKEVK